MKLKNYAFPLLAVLIWAVNTIVTKMAAGVVEPAAIAFYRWLIAGVLLGLVFGKPVWAVRGVVWHHLPKLFVLGILGMVLYQCLAYIAAQSTSATNMGILASLMPLLALGLSIVLLGETASLGGVVGGLIALLGLVYLLSQGHPINLLTHGAALGDGLMLLACLSYATYSVLMRRWMIPLHNWHALLVQIWCALPILFIYYLMQGAPPVSAAAVPLMLFAGLPTSILAPFLWMVGVGQLGPSRATTLMNLMPIFTILIAIVFLGETLYLHHIIGGGVTLLGVVLAQCWKRPLRQTARQ